MNAKPNAGDSGPWGVMAELASADELLAAARAARAAGYRHAEAYAPFPVEGLAEALGFRRSWVAPITFLGGVAGGVGGYFMQWYSAVVDYAINVGGRPLHSWPMFIPVTFELTVLGGALAAVLALFISNGLPNLYHPIFNAPDFDLAMRNRFFLCLRSDDPAFDAEGAARLLDGLKPLRRAEVPR
jgi:ActD protein